MNSLTGVIRLAKKLIRLKGPDSLTLLQGLLTNDVLSSTKVKYSYLLNSQGRVMFDLFLYHVDKDEVLLETDASLEQSLMKVLNLYKLRRSVTIESTPYLAGVCYDPGDMGFIGKPDPRISELGIKTLYEKAPNFVPREDEYRDLRYRLGVPEGSQEFGLGKAIPLETNGDYLSAISFDKGCYIGQELTARAYHTGVVRKRYMPLEFLDPPNSEQGVADQPVLNEKNAKVGVLKAVSKTRGLGLMRIRDALEAQQLTVEIGNQKTLLKVFCPAWWPKIASP